MKDLGRILLGIIAAFMVYTVLEKISVSTILIVNVLSLVVLYFAMEKGEVFGAFLGMFVGLIQDSFSFGIFGVAGIAKTVMGFVAGFIAKRINVVSFRRSFLFIFLMSGIELILWSVLYGVLLAGSINTGNGILFFQPLGTALIGSCVFLVIRKITSGRSGD